MDQRPLPLNGVKTHPLKPASISALRQLARGPVRAHTLNPGVRDRLWRENLAMPDSRNYWHITDAGRSALKQGGE